MPARMEIDLVRASSAQAPLSLRTSLRQLRIIRRDEHGEQACGFGAAGILADEMAAARWLEEALAGLVHLRRSAGRNLRADRADQHISKHAACVVMRGRFAARRIFHHE